MQVSRPTLRLALARLEKEGAIARHGRLRRSIPQAPRRPQIRRCVIGLLSPLELSAMQEHELIWLSELRRKLASSGYELMIQVRPGFFKSQGMRAMNRFKQETAVECWILHRSPILMQSWFAENLPQSIVAGSTYPDIRLSSVDIDNRAACRHAVGRLTRGGHISLCYVGPRIRNAGDIESEEGFLESLWTPLGKDKYDHHFVRHDGTPDSLVRGLEGVLSREGPPTGFIVANSNHTLTTLTYLATRGLMAGRDYALIARDDAPFFNHVVPTIARYSNMPGRIAQELAGMALRHARALPDQRQCKRIIPEFIPGASLSKQAFHAPRLVG